jgi:hypothetical protein
VCVGRVLSNCSVRRDYRSAVGLYRKYCFKIERITCGKSLTSLVTDKFYSLVMVHSRLHPLTMSTPT